MHYILPPLQKQDMNDFEPDIPTSEKSSGPDQWERTITLPVNEDILEALSIDDDARITLTGKITEIRKNEHSEGSAHRSISIEISSIEAYPESEETAEKEFETGFDKGHAKRYRN